MKQNSMSQTDFSVAEKKRNTSQTKRLTYVAVMVAISVTLKMLGNILNLGAFKVSFVYLGYIVSGIMLGPFYGLAVGFITDVVGQLLIPTGGAILPLILLGNTLFPFFVGLAYRYAPIKNRFIKIIIGTVSSILFCTLGLSSIGLYLAFYNSMPFTVYIVSYRLIQVVIVLVNLMVVLLLTPMLKSLRYIK